MCAARVPTETGKSAWRNALENENGQGIVMERS